MNAPSTAYLELDPVCCRDDYFDGYGYPPEAQGLRRRSKKGDGGFLVLLAGIWHAFFG